MRQDNYKKNIIILWTTFLLCLASIPLYVFCVNIDLFGLFGALPSYTILENPENELSSELYSADGKLLGKYYRFNRSWAEYNEISSSVINALIAAEDWRFYKHSGIDLKGLFRAAILSVILRKNKGGGSTISQQLAKNLFKTRSDKYKGILNKIPIIRLFVTKTKEWIVAAKLERAYTKEEIISMYLNTVSFGSNTFGIKSAAKTFFDTKPYNITLNQAALLIGLLRAPTRYSPILNPKNSKRRRNVILYQMYKTAFITKDKYEYHSKLPINLKYKVESHNSGIATYFRAIVGSYLLKWTKENGYDLYSDGLKIYTTLDSRLQKHAEESVKEHMMELQEKFYEHWQLEPPWVDENSKVIKNFIKNNIKNTDLYKKLIKEYGSHDKNVERIINTPRGVKIFTWHGDINVNMSLVEETEYNKKLLRAGFMALEPSTGNIKAWVGGINFKHFKYDHVLQGKRQPGSIFKPFVYMVALDNGFSPNDIVRDIPVTFNIPGGFWTPQNWYKFYTGKKMTLRQALARSINSVTAYLIKKMTPKLVVTYAKRMGIKSYLDPVPSICLGTSDLSLYELMGAYNVFANRGIWTKPMFITRIEDKYGNVIKSFNHVQKEAINEHTAYLMTYMLKGAQQEHGGSAWRLHEEIKKGNEIASKSGTTQNHSDGWFIGLTHNLCAGVWVGGEDRCIHFKDFRSGQSGKTAKPIWEKFMVKVYKDPDLHYKKGKFSKPSHKARMNKRVKKYLELEEKNILKEETKNADEHAEEIKEEGPQDTEINIEDLY